MTREGFSLRGLDFVKGKSQPLKLSDILLATASIASSQYRPNANAAALVFSSPDTIGNLGNGDDGSWRKASKNSRMTARADSVQVSDLGIRSRLVLATVTVMSSRRPRSRPRDGLNRPDGALANARFQCRSLHAGLSPSNSNRHVLEGGRVDLSLI